MLFGLVRVKVRLQAREHREDEVPERGVLSDEEARRVDVGVLQGGLLLGGDVLLLRAVPHFLQARPGRKRDVGPGVVHGLVLDEPPLLFVQLRQDGHPRLLKARTRRVSSHVKLAEKEKFGFHASTRRAEEVFISCPANVFAVPSWKPPSGWF